MDIEYRSFEYIYKKFGGKMYTEWIIKFSFKFIFTLPPLISKTNTESPAPNTSLLSNLHGRFHWPELDYLNKMTTG